MITDAQLLDVVSDFEARDPHFVWERVYRLARIGDRPGAHGLFARKELETFGTIGDAARDAVSTRSAAKSTVAPGRYLVRCDKHSHVEIVQPGANRYLACGQCGADASFLRIGDAS